MADFTEYPELIRAIKNTKYVDNPHACAGFHPAKMPEDYERQESARKASGPKTDAAQAPQSPDRSVAVLDDRRPVQTGKGA